MTANTGTDPDGGVVPALPLQCWCCERAFGEDGVVQMPANKEWLASLYPSEAPRQGICEDCAIVQNACFYCGRVSDVEVVHDEMRETWPLRPGDCCRLQGARIGGLVLFCEPCLVRNHLMDSDFMEAVMPMMEPSLSKEVA